MPEYLILLDEQELSTVLAALRYYQQHGLGDPWSRPPDIHDIATNNGEVVSLDADAIDTMCEKINTAGEPHYTVFLKNIEEIAGGLFKTVAAAREYCDGEPECAIVEVNIPVRFRGDTDDGECDEPGDDAANDNPVT